MKSKTIKTKVLDDREVCNAYFADQVTLKDCIKAIGESDRGDIRRREIEAEFNRISKHYRFVAQ